MIRLEKVTLGSGGFRLHDISMHIDTGSYAVLMGQTGQGKTTLLETICGLRRVESGRIILHGSDITRWQPGARQIGYVPQDLVLFPTMSVREHLQFGLKIRGHGRKSIAQRTDELASLLGIEGLIDRRTAALSGGEKQRVALGRALAIRPAALLLDEPLSALDQVTRKNMQQLLKTINRNERVTTLHVTHNEDEAQELADVRFDLADGKLA